MALSVCLLPDQRTDRAVRALWSRLEAAGIATLASHTHGHHRPHLTLASLLTYDLDQVRSALTALPAQEPLAIDFEAVGMFRRSRCWLAPVPVESLLVRQRLVVETVTATGAELHRNYRPGAWTPHLTLAPRLRLEQLATVARLTFESLPLTATLDQAALVDTSTGALHPLPHPV